MPVEIVRHLVVELIPAVDLATRLTVTFTPTPDGTQLDLTHDRLDGLRDRYPHIAEHVEPGWESALDKLATVGR